MLRPVFLTVLIILVVSSIARAVSISMHDKAQTFATWDSLEPDKWSSIWLIKKHIDSNVNIEVRPTGTPLDGYMTFGVPQAKYRRSGNRSTFEALLKGYQQTDPILLRMGKLITQIETTSWNTANDPFAYTIEQNFRYLQDRFNRFDVPVNCYAHFFDVLYVGLQDALSSDELNQMLVIASRNESCANGVVIAQRRPGDRVKELPIEHLLSEIAQGKKVVFVDTREPTEYAKSHIPGAINIPMRNLNDEVYSKLKQADRVISYCVKDFRGYEVARKMLENGVNRVAVMQPHGLSGWRSVGLPLSSPENTANNIVKEQLYRCAKEQQTCLKSTS